MFVSIKYQEDCIISLEDMFNNNVDFPDHDTNCNVLGPSCDTGVHNIRYYCTIHLFMQILIPFWFDVHKVKQMQSISG